jgi:hypothetical protein
VEATEKLLYPRDIRGIRSFLGHAGFYRRFIKYFSKVSQPLTNLLKKDIPFFPLIMIVLNLLKLLRKL